MQPEVSPSVVVTMNYSVAVGVGNALVSKTLKINGLVLFLH